MKPVLYDVTETQFNSYGLGVLNDAISCNVTMQDTQYELQMEYPVDGVHFSDIAGNRIVFAKPCQTDDPQPFRIYRITKPIKGRVTVYARHISYDLSGIPVTPFEASSAADFASKISQNAVVSCPFTFQTNLSVSKSTKFDYPQTARYLLSDNAESWQEVYGGELVFDKYQVKLLAAAGANRGVVIRYGIDLVDAKMEENISAVYTGILPYYWDSQTETLIVGSVLSAAGTFNYTKILPVDVTEYITSDEATQSKVNEVGQVWLDENMIGMPKISLSLTYAQINQVVRLYDTVTVKVEKLGIDVMAKITSTVYDALKERYLSINVGDVRETFAVDIYDASRLKTGLLDLKRIKDKSIGSQKIAAGGVGSVELADWSVIREKLAEKAVGEDNCDSSITGYFNGSKAFSSLQVSGNSLWLNGKRLSVRQSAGGYYEIAISDG